MTKFTFRKAMNFAASFAKYPRMRMLQLVGFSNVIYGYKLYDKPLLLSYSRSGTNVVRGMIENLLMQPTPGQPRFYTGFNFCIDRAHFAPKDLSKYKKVIFLVRSHKECIARHLNEQLETEQQFKEFLVKGDQPGFWYIRNLEMVARYTGKKLIIYYEDLIVDPESILRKLAEFLDVDHSTFLKVDNELEKILKLTQSSYLRGGHETKSLSSSKFKFHSEKLMINEELKIDNYVKRCLSPESQDIISRYFHDN